MQLLNFGGMRSDGTSALCCGDDRVSGHFFGQSSFASHALQADGRLPFEKLITLHDFDQIDEAVADHKVGRSLKAVLRPPTVTGC